MTQKIPYYYALPAIIISTLFLTAVIFAQFQEPSEPPPQGNVPPPLNIGPSGQSKIGGLILNTGGAITGLVVDKGNVGIGTQTPGYKLEVAGQIKITGGSPGIGKILTSDASGLASWQVSSGGGLPSGTSGQTLRHDGASWVANSNLFNNNTNVGIGTTSPGAKLEVAGQIKITGGSPGIDKVLTSDASGLASWQTQAGGNLPSGIADQTLRHDGTDWVANSFLKILSNGVVAINQQLNIGGSSLGNLNIGTGGWGGAVNIDAGSNPLAVRVVSAGATRFEIMNGRIGIGGAPDSSHRLKVLGDTKLDGNLEATGSITLGGESRSSWPQIKVCWGVSSSSDLPCSNPNFPNKLGQWHSKNFNETWICGYRDCGTTYSCSSGDVHRAVWLCGR